MNNLKTTFLISFQSLKLNFRCLKSSLLILLLNPLEKFDVNSNFLYCNVINSLQVYERIKIPEAERPKDDPLSTNVDITDGGRKAVVSFTAAAVAVMENEGKVRLGIKRIGHLDTPVSVRLETNIIWNN